MLRTNTPPPTILVVEDDNSQSEIVATLLDLYNMLAVTMPDGASALHWLADHTPDMVILDLMLPDMSGLDVCQQIRKRHPLPSLPVLMLSAAGHEADMRVRGLEVGANDFVAKPYNIKELILRIQGLLIDKSEKSTSLLFSRYITQVMRHQAEFNPEAMNMRQQLHAAILFADLRGFTHMSQAANSSQILGVLDTFFEVMLRLIDANGGSVFELIGDELLAGFGVSRPMPSPSISAMNTAVQMREQLDILKRKWSAEGLTVGMGIGIHRGEVTLGNVGAAELTRYTIVGNPVNIAHRLVDLANDGETIVSTEVHTDLSPMAGTTPFQMMPNVQLKGLDLPLTAYRVQAPGRPIRSNSFLSAANPSLMMSFAQPQDSD